MAGVRGQTDGDRWMCRWEGCDHAAAVEVLTGDLGGRRKPYGHYCVPHSVIISRKLREEEGIDVWFAVIAPEPTWG